MKKRKDKLISVYLMFGLILLVIGFSYAFFIYNKTGLYTHTITGGKMKVIYDELVGNNITIENAYPRTDEEALTYGLEFEFTVTGYNESEKDIFYMIEMDYGDDIENKTRFLDSDLKLTLYENEELVFENEIFENLDNQGIYYSYFKHGTSADTPTINNYKMRLWINDNVIISDNLSKDLSTWSDTDWDMFCDAKAYGEYIYAQVNYYDGSTELTYYGYNLYTSEEFASRYSNFKVNVRANLTGQDIGVLMYDANGGINTPSATSLTTNRVTMQKPVMENKAFLGWNSNPSATEIEYKSGDFYSGVGKTLYAVYGDIRNIMTDLTAFDTYASQVTNVYFVSDTKEKIESKYNNAVIKADLTYNNQGQVLGWLEEDYLDEETSIQYYNLYVASDSTTYFSTGRNLFTGWTSLRNIEFTNIDTSMVTDMYAMFGGHYDNEYNFIVGANNLVSLDLESFNTSEVTDMGGMFFGLYNLTELDVSKFDTAKVTNMAYMFGSETVYDPSQIIELDLSNFDTSNVTNMEGMFQYNGNLSNLDISGFDTAKVTNMSNMFGCLSSLSKLDVSSFDTSNVKNMSSMFGGGGYFPTAIKKLDLRHFNTSNVIDMSHLFSSCVNLTEIDLSNFDTSKVIDMSYMFSETDKLKRLDLKNFDTSNVENMEGMFSQINPDQSELEYLDISSFNTSKVTNMGNMFSDCRLTKLDLSHFNTSQVTNMRLMFRRCFYLTDVNLSSFDITNVTDMISMFYQCYDLVNLDLSNFSTSSLQSTIGMFYECTSLVNLNIENLDTSQVTSMKEMFYKCSSLVSLNLSSFDTSKVANIQSMFQGCTKLTELDISEMDLTSIKNYSYVFSSMPSNAVIYVNNTNNQSFILSISTSYRPHGWSNSNVIIKSV